MRSVGAAVVAAFLFLSCGGVEEDDDGYYEEGYDPEGEITSLEQPATYAGKLGIIGDSLTTATNSDDACGAGGEVGQCISAKLASYNDTAWSHAGGSQTWALWKRLGFSGVVNKADPGARWKDAYGQAVALMNDTSVTGVYIFMGNNDVCRPYGHVYGTDLTTIKSQIDQVLTFLISKLKTRGSPKKIWIAGLPNLKKFRDLMYGRAHDYVFKQCRYLWRLDMNNVTSEAMDSLCKQKLGNICDLLPSSVKSWALDLYTDKFMSEWGDEDFPCGNLLDSRNTSTQLTTVQTFNANLNAAIKAKRDAYAGKDGVAIAYTDKMFYETIRPYYISKLDCFHANRAGQMRMARTIYNGFTGSGFSDVYYFDQMADTTGTDWCLQEFTTWGGCWIHGGDDGFEYGVTGSGWFKLEKDTSKDRTHWVERKIGNLSAKSKVMVFFNHKRENLDSSSDRVDFQVYKDGVYTRIDYFQGGGNDTGIHCGKYYDLTAYKSADMRIRFITNNSDNMKDNDRVMWDNMLVFAW